MINSATEYSVTLTPELFQRIQTEANRLGIAMEWLVASLVLDTLDSERYLAAG